ncbi:MAG TPA: TonB-dependent receptor [Terriglobales bacterium]|nr:TonB-dependent receptor [Terriglobales bacterium]
MSSKNLLGPFCLFFIVLFLSGSLLAQATGTISGRAIDSAGAVLQGARVETEPRLTRAVTGSQGEFTIPDVPAGDYSLTVSYVGFSQFTTRVTVASGQIARVEAKLVVAGSSEQVTVYGGRQHGEAEAINRQLTSDNILQVLPVEVITSLPNTNIADALGRLPSVTLERDEGEGKYVQIRGLEPRLANVTIDAVNVPSPESGVRQIKLDVIPANLVDSVEINKTLSANQDGDAVAGSVNLVTKTASERPTLYLNGIGGYTPIVGGRSLYELDGTVGKRFGSNKRLGVIFGGSYDWNGRGIDDVEPVPTAIQCDSGSTGCQAPGSNAPFATTYSTQDWREYRYYRTRYGFTGAVDYKLSDISGLYVRFLYSHFDNFGDRWAYSPQTNSDDTTSGWLTPGLTDTNASISFNAQIRRPVEVIGSLVAGGKHVFNRWLLAYDLSVARASSEDHGYASASFDGPGNLQFAIDTTNPHSPKFIPQGGFGTIFDPATYTLSNLDIGQSYSPQLNLQGGFSVAKNYELGGHFSTFEFGAKVRNAHKFQDARDPVYNSVDNPAMAAFLGTFTNSNYYDKNYTFGPTVDYSKITAYFKNHAVDPNFFTQDLASSAQNSFPNNYDLVERIAAGYFMNTIEFGRVRLQTGLRFEGTKEDVLGYQVLFDSGGNLCEPGDTDPVCGGVTNPVMPIRRTSSYLDALPCVQLRFRLPHDAAIRASYGRGISRPNYSDLPPTFSYQGNNNEVDVGNPNLKPSRANNYDLLYEQYLKPLGLLQGGFFFKQLSNPIYESVKSQLTPTLAQQYGISPTSIYVTDMWDLSRPLNGKSATVYGFEIAYQQHLSFLPGPLGGIGLSANYGYTHSTTAGVPLRTDTPALQRQAPNSWNISPTYDRWRVSARLGVSHNDANIFSYNYSNINSDGSPNPVPLGIKGPNGDTYLYGHTQVDAQASFRMYRGLQLVVAGLNLTNEVFGFYNGSTQFPIQREYYKTSYMFGLRYTLSNEPK